MTTLAQKESHTKEKDQQNEAIVREFKKAKHDGAQDLALRVVYANPQIDWVQVASSIVRDKIALANNLASDNLEVPEEV